jgi:hypothetical protein
MNANSSCREGGASLDVCDFPRFPRERLDGAGGVAKSPPIGQPLAFHSFDRQSDALHVIDAKADAVRVAERELV